MRPAHALLATAAAATLTLAGPAVADDELRISSMSTTSAGLTEQLSGASSGDGSGWSLNVMAGDRVTLEWEADDLRTDLYVVRDASSDAPFVHDELEGNGRSRVTFSAKRSGTVPLRFVVPGQETVGSYSFSAVIQHRAHLSLARTGTRAARGTLDVRVRSADGAALGDPSLMVSLQARRAGEHGFTTIGTAPVSDGLASVAYKVPARLRDRPVVLRAVALQTIAGGSGYVPQVITKQRTTFG